MSVYLLFVLAFVCLCACVCVCVCVYVCGSVSYHQAHKSVPVVAGGVLTSLPEPNNNAVLLDVLPFSYALRHYHIAHVTHSQEPFAQLHLSSLIIHGPRALHDSRC